MAKTLTVETFDEDLFETRLEALKDTQDGIQQMSSWCLQHRTHHKKIVICWLNVLKRVRVEHRLVLFYLANDVIQYSKRKRYEFVESWATALQRATTMVRDEKVKGKVLRIFKIWEQRDIYSEEYLSDLSGLLNISPPKKSQANVPTSDDFTNVSFVANIRDCVQLSDSTDKSFKKLPKAPSCDIDNIKLQLKDKSHTEDVEKEIERYMAYITAFNKNIHNEIKSRKAVIDNLDAAIKFYSSQKGELKVVVSAYKNFGSRIKAVKKKLDELINQLPSPMPSPDINAPSPEREADLQLPDEQSPISINLFKNNMNGYASYLDGNLPFDINDFKRESSSSKISSQPIEVIGSRSDDESYASSVEYYKPESLSSYSSNTSMSIPGLNPMPVPPVQSEYTSLARTVQQYNNVLSPATPSHYSNSINNSYSPHLSSYSGDTYSTTDNSSTGVIMQPPPMPPVALSGNGSGSHGQTSSSDEFNSTWDMNMSWTPLDTSSASSSSYGQATPHSPPHFEREARSGGTAPIEYSEHGNNNTVSAQDVDHRQLHLPPAFNCSNTKLGLSKDKSRQLVDIDHRNLISLTGSPGINDIEKKSWSDDKNDIEISTTGDVDYRTGVGQLPRAIDSSIASPNSFLTPLSTNIAKKSISPQKSNASSSSHESAKDETGSVSRYDPSDMVVDMDMSDEDIDEILKEANDEQQEEDTNLSTLEPTVPGDDSAQAAGHQIEDASSSAAAGIMGRPALLDTPPEYVPQNVWENTVVPINVPAGYAGANIEIDMQQQPPPPPQQQQQQQQLQQQPHPAWNQVPPMPWNGNMGAVPPPPRPPFPLQFQYPPGGAGEFGGGNGENMRGRGRGRGWVNSGPNPYRHNFPRGLPRGGAAGAFEGGRPYFNHRGSGNGGRGAFRGRFRGNNLWH